MKVQVINSSNNELPRYATSGAAGMDLHANIEGDVVIEPGQSVLIPTGLRMAIPFGYEVQIRPRSGNALKYGITCPNTPATIDSDYRGDVGVILMNLGLHPFVVHNGDRIAQMVLKKVETVEWEIVDTLPETDRGEGGFGHTGI